MSNLNLEILKFARGLIADENRWCQGNSAKDQYGVAAHPCDPSAVQWCAMGAIQVATKNLEPWIIVENLELIKKKSDELFNMGFVNVNDRLGHEAVMQIFDKVILELREKVE